MILKSGGTNEIVLKLGSTPPTCVGVGDSHPQTTLLYHRGVTKFSPSCESSLLVSESEGRALMGGSAISWFLGLAGSEFARARAFFWRLYLIDIFICWVISGKRGLMG